MSTEGASGSSSRFSRSAAEGLSGLGGGLTCADGGGAEGGVELLLKNLLHVSGASSPESWFLLCRTVAKQFLLFRPAPDEDEEEEEEEGGAEEGIDEGLRRLWSLDEYCRNMSFSDRGESSRGLLICSLRAPTFTTLCCPLVEALFCGEGVEEERGAEEEEEEERGAEEEPSLPQILQ